MTYIDKKIEEFREKFGQFYVSIDAKTRAIRIVDIENAIKVNGEDGSQIECVASGDIEKFLSEALTTQRLEVIEEVQKGIEDLDGYLPNEAEHIMVEKDDIIKLLTNLKTHND